MSDRNVVPSLEDVCVRWISKNLHLLTTNCSRCSECELLWRFPFPDCRIIARPAEKILLKLCKRSILKDEHMSLFSSLYVDLVSPVLKDVNLSPDALKFLRDFELYNLTATNLRQLNLHTLIGCLGEDSIKNLNSLNVSNMAIEENNLLTVASLGRLKNLQILNVSRTKFNNDCLAVAVNILPRLRHLNISRTSINNINNLLSLRHNLTSLFMHRLNLSNDSSELDQLLCTVIELRELRILDISSESQKEDIRVPCVERLCSSDSLPHLVHLDICGNLLGLRLADVTMFIENHPALIFLGVAAWPQRQRHDIEGLHLLSLKYPNITMLGDRGEKPLLATLTRNKDRRIYLQNAFHRIFEETSLREWLNPDLLAAVLRVMRIHMGRSQMILAGTAVVYNLARGELSSYLPLELLNRAVEITLTSIDRHQDLLQLLKNCFLTLCSDTVLHRAQFNCKRCCELVFRSLINHDDVHLKRMGVAIISILAAEVPTSDLRELSSDRQRFERLLIYVVEKCLLTSDVEELLEQPGGDKLQYLSSARPLQAGSPIYDTTLRFTLSALWNLTDECPEACMGFVNVGGLLVYAKVLKKMADQEEDFKNHVYTKCLGLLNNVAEVNSTKTTLLTEPLMNFFFKMLSHTSIQISYFAAGIVAHLLCLSDDTWTAARQYLKSSYIKVLGNSVRNWSPPQTEMVAYRSFQPFQSLILHPNSRLEIHLWAVWAIHHILTKKDSRYVPVLRECPDLQLFLHHVISTNPSSLCVTEYTFGQFLRALNHSHDSSMAVRYKSMLTTSKEPLSDTMDSLNTSNKLEISHSWPHFSHILTQYRNMMATMPNVSSESPNKISSSQVSFCAPHLPAKRAQLQSIDSATGFGDCITSFVGVQTPTDSVARLPTKLCTDISEDETPSTSAFIGPDENQMACALLLQKLAREILQAVKHFESITNATH